VDESISDVDSMSQAYADGCPSEGGNIKEYVKDAREEELLSAAMTCSSTNATSLKASRERLGKVHRPKGVTNHQRTRVLASTK